MKQNEKRKLCPTMNKALHAFNSTDDNEKENKCVSNHAVHVEFMYFHFLNDFWF